MKLDKINVILASVLIVGSILLVAVRLAPVRAQSNGTGLPPMLVTYKREVFSANGQLRWSRTYTVARNRTGSISETYIHNDSGRNQNFEVHTVIDQDTRTTTGWYPLVKLKSTTPLSGPQFPLIAGPCDGPEQKTVLGFTVVSAEHDFAAPIGGGITIRTKAWRAKELGCFEVMRETIASKSDGSSGGRDITTPTTMVLGDPPAELFVVPQDYAEAKPSEIMKAVHGTLGIECAACALNTGLAADKRYEMRNAGH